MLAQAKNSRKHSPLSRPVAYALLLLTFLWAFLGTIDGPAANFGNTAGFVIYKTPKVFDSGHDSQPEPFWSRAFQVEPLPVHVSFLLFDFKQNLRQWPNVSGNISRSPPFFLAV